MIKVYTRDAENGPTELVSSDSREAAERWLIAEGIDVGSVDIVEEDV